MGVQPRTGYVCGPVKPGYSSRVDAFVDYLAEVVQWVAKQTSMRECIMLLPEIVTKSDSFHLYQVEMICAGWNRLQFHDFGLRLVSGPGMLPVCLSMLGRHDVYFDESEEHQRGEGEFGEVTASHAQPRKKVKTTRRGTWTEARMATSLCHHLTRLVATSPLLLAVCAYIGTDGSAVVNYDEFEYFLCELRRLLCNPVPRNCKRTPKGLTPQQVMVQDKVRVYLARCQEYARKKFTGGFSSNISFKQFMKTAL